MARFFLLAGALLMVGCLTTPSAPDEPATESPTISFNHTMVAKACPPDPPCAEYGSLAGTVRPTASGPTPVQLVVEWTPTGPGTQRIEIALNPSGGGDDDRPSFSWHATSPFNETVELSGTYAINFRPAGTPQLGLDQDIHTQLRGWVRYIEPGPSAAPTA